MLKFWSNLTIGYGLFMAILPTFHIIKMYRSKSSDGQSMVTIVGLEIGFAVWLVYGFLIEDSVIIIPNIIALLIGVIYLYTVRYYRGKI